MRDLFLEPDGTLVLEETGYKLYEDKDAYGESTFLVYSDAGDYICEFEGKSLTDEQLKNKRELRKTKVYDQFLDIIDDFEQWDSDWLSDGGKLDDSDMNWLKWTAPEKQEMDPEAKKELMDSLCKSDTIVFHQTDPTTVMLDPIYEGRGWDVYKDSMWSGPLEREDIHELIKKHDKIVCLGHGTPNGLLSGIIGSSEAEILKEKKVFALWCYAATYFKNHGFQGHGVLCSDNAPSEVWECKAACNADVSADWIYNNMLYWSECLKDVIEMGWDNPEEACHIARENYHKAIDDCKTEDERKVVEFNTNTLQVV